MELHWSQPAFTVNRVNILIQGLLATSVQQENILYIPVQNWNQIALCVQLEPIRQSMDRPPVLYAKQVNILHQGLMPAYHAS